jgi:hypothetical protein
MTDESAGAYALKGQLEPLLPRTVLVIDEERTIGPYSIRYVRGHDKRETLHFDILIRRLWLIQSQAHFGPPSPKSADKDSEQILFAVRVSPF